MLIPPTRFFITKKNYHSLFVARTWQHFIDLLKRKNPRFTAFLDSNVYIKLAPNGARWAPALALRPRRGPAGQPVALRAAGQAVACGHAPPFTFLAL